MRSQTGVFLTSAVSLREQEKQLQSLSVTVLGKTYTIPFLQPSIHVSMRVLNGTC